MFASVYKNINTNAGMPVDHQDNFAAEMPTEGDGSEAQWLKYLLYITLGFGFIEIIMSYDKYDFLNVKIR